MAVDRNVTFRPPGPVARAFMRSDAFVRGIRGPLGSGKSTTCVCEILRRCGMQQASPDGVTRTRWAIIRNTSPELKTTTIKTWDDWIPTSFGKLTMDSPITHRVKNDQVDHEFLFLGLDKPEDARKLLSLELTGAWVNEARQINKGIIDALTGRVGRYPSKSQGGATWSGIIMDTNPPDTENWWYQLAETDARPADWAFFGQPSGLAADAENLPNLPADYYQRICGGKDDDWIKVYVHGEYGFVTEGQPVFPMYRDGVHCNNDMAQPVDRLPLLIGGDAGLTPAAIIGQHLADGRWLILDEVVADDVGPTRFSEYLAAYVARHYAGYEVAGCWGDPAGEAKIDEHTYLEIMTRNTGWKWRAAPTNDPDLRLEVVRNSLNRMIDGRPGLIISPRCKVLRKGFTGGYHRKWVRALAGGQLHEQPAKNAYSHPHDALQYLLLGGGEHNVVLHRVRDRSRPRHRLAADVDYRVFGR